MTVARHFMQLKTFLKKYVPSIFEVGIKKKYTVLFRIRIRFSLKVTKHFGT
jgi:hypothetical protein